MKTFAEALKCLESEGKSMHGTVMVGESGVTVDYEDDNPQMRSIGELAIEVGDSRDFRDLMYQAIGANLGAGEGNPVKVPMFIATKLHEIFLMAFTYGVRVGIEMEKSEEPMPV